MKTIKKIEKEIRKIEKKKGDLEYLDSNWIISKAKLSYAKAICEMIEEDIRKLRKEKLDRYGVKYPNQTIKIKIKILEELILKIKGEEK